MNTQQAMRETNCALAYGSKRMVRHNNGLYEVFDLSGFPEVEMAAAGVDEETALRALLGAAYQERPVISRALFRLLGTLAQ